MKNKCNLHLVAGIILVIGGINWGLVGLFDFNLVSAAFGSWPIVEKVVYLLVGASALIALVSCKCPRCNASIVSQSE